MAKSTQKMTRKAGEATAIGSSATPAGIAVAGAVQEFAFQDMSTFGFACLATIFSTVIAFVVGYFLKPGGERDTSFVEAQTLAPVDHEAVRDESYAPGPEYTPRHSGEGDWSLNGNPDEAPEEVEEAPEVETARYGLDTAPEAAEEPAEEETQRVGAF